MTTENKTNKQELRIVKAKDKLMKMASAKASDKKILKQVEMIRDLEKKAKKKAKKTEKVQNAIAKKKASKVDISAENGEGTENPSVDEVPARGFRSIKLSYREAVSTLQSIPNLADLKRFLKDENRPSVLKRAESRQRVLGK